MPETNNQKMTVETNGLQIKVWIPQDFYDLLRARSARFHTSVAQEARKLMQAGRTQIKPSETLEAVVADLDRYLRLHLEPLAFIAAMDSAYDAASWHRLWSTTPGGKNAQDLEKLEHQLREQATKRIQRKLRELPSDEADPEEEEEDDD